MGTKGKGNGTGGLRDYGTLQKNFYFGREIGGECPKDSFAPTSSTARLVPSVLFMINS